MKRVLLDYTDIDMTRVWPSETWTTPKSTFLESQSIDGKAGSRRKPATAIERRKQRKDNSLTCNICFKRFSRKAVLDAHRMSHELTCLQCGCQSETVIAHQEHQFLHKEELHKRLNAVVPTKGESNGLEESRKHLEVASLSELRNTEVNFREATGLNPSTRDDLELRNRSRTRGWWNT